MERGFILYLTYGVRENKTIAQYYGRLENGETFLAELQRTPYFYIKQEDEKRAEEYLQPYETEATTLKTIDEQPVTKVLVQQPKDVPPLRDKLHDNNIACYEADIRFSYRQLIDEQLNTAVYIEGSHSVGARIDRIYKEPKLTKAQEYNGELRTLSIDLETNKETNTLWSAALATTDEEHALLIDREANNANCVPDEKTLLTELNKLIQEIDPDIITGWNVIDFDLDLLQKKYREHNIPFDWSREVNREARLRVESDFLRDSSADIVGRVVLDGIHLLKWNFVDLGSYSLESAAAEYTKAQKLFTGKNRFEDIENAYNNDPETLVKYNIQDAKLVLEILDNSGVLDLTKKRSLLTSMPLDRVKASIASLDMVYLPRLQKRGYVAPTSGYTRKNQGITGGFVMESKPGIYDNILVLDFKSLYPSIMCTLNIDPLTYDPSIENENSTKEYVRAENGACFKQKDGILPEILLELWDERSQATKNDDQLARFAIKILMNSFFGVLASPNCRFFSMEVSNAITHTGQHLIKTLAQNLREQNIEVIYGDTDSIFVDPKTPDTQKAHSIGQQIEQEANEFFADYTKERYKRKSYLELEFEKLYTRFLMPRTRGGGGSKKRYAGLLVDENGKQEIDVTGLELVRRDWTELAKRFQKHLLELIFESKDPKEYIKEFVDKLRAGELDELLVYKKALRKSLDEYTKTTPPHVKAARLLDTEITNNLIEYVQTVDGPEPVGKIQHSLDYEHYIQKQLRPIADGILNFYGTNFDDVLRGTTQKGLMDF